HQCKAKLKLKPANYYGATEMGSVCLADPDRAGHDATWLGHAMPGVEMRILDPDSHRPLPDGAFGEIAVHAPSAMTGYIQSDGVVDRESAFVWINNKKYFLTGDLGTRDPSGHLRYQARRKLLIDVGANKVNPIEVESILCLHPRVSAAMVSGERLNQTVHRLSAVVEPSDEEHPPTAAELRAHCRHHLAAWKVPRTFTFETLARTALGKVIRVKPEVVPN
ncbi:MAG: class I adenylate-forming enzyme family protein, partial [Phycisphaeraceae bacterium]